MPAGVNDAWPITSSIFCSVVAEGVDLRIEPATQRHRLVEHGLRRRPPFVDGALRAFVVPDAAVAQPRHVVVGQLLPGARLVEAERRVEQCRLELDEAGHAGHHLARAAVVEQRAERNQRVAEGVVTRQGLHRRPRAAVGRAKHQQPCTVTRHHALPGVGRLEPHRSRDQAAHRVGEQSHRLAAGAARGECRIDGLRQAPRFVFDRAPPVVGERDHLVRVGQALDQVVVAAADRAIGFDARCGGGVPGKLLKAIDEAEAEPDALAVELEVRAEDAGQYEHGRAIGRGARAGGTAARARHGPGRTRAARILPGP